MNDVTSLSKEIAETLANIRRPTKAVVTAGMPYANGPIHIGHLAGAHIPADIYARWLGMLIGRDNVLFVCGSDDHGSNSEVSARKENTEVDKYVQQINKKQKQTLEKYHIDLDVYAGTSHPDCKEDHTNICQDFLRKLHANNMLEEKSTDQWYDPEFDIFLPDRFVTGTCPLCDNEGAYSEECDICQGTYEATKLKEPKSALGNATPELRETVHAFLNMWTVVDPLREWLEDKQGNWRKTTLMEILGNVNPSVIFSNKFENTYRDLKEDLPEHKSRYASGKKIIVQFGSLSKLEKGKAQLEDAKIECQLLDSWAHRSITRDVAWGIPVPKELGSKMKGKTFYVWPESLIAPLAFTRLALKKKGQDPELYKEYWCDPHARVYQFLGQDNIFFYTLMQGAMWLGTQKDPLRAPLPGELQMSTVFSSFHLQIDGAKMSKSLGNFYTGDQLLEEKGLSTDQVRYFLSLLSLSEKNSNLEFETLEERNAFLAGPLNAAFEKPISACHSKFGGKIPSGKLVGKTAKESKRVVEQYFRMMQKEDYSKVLFMLENYARLINRLFATYKPHDDRHEEEARADALYSSFYILRNLMIMLYPFVPSTIEKLRASLNLEESIYNVDELGKMFPEGHSVGKMDEYFPKVSE